MVAIKSVGGVPPPIEPLQNGYRVTKSDLYSDSTGRSAETGHLLQYLIRKDIVSIELQYEGSEEQIEELESLFSGTSLSVVYRDNRKYFTKDMYPSDRVKDIISLKNEGRIRFSVTLVEV